MSGEERKPPPSHNRFMEHNLLKNLNKSAKFQQKRTINRKTKSIDNETTIQLKHRNDSFVLNIRKGDQWP